MEQAGNRHGIVMEQSGNSQGKSGARPMSNVRDRPFAAIDKADLPNLPQ